MSGPFIRRPVATTLLAIAIFLAGLLGYANLAVSPLPAFDTPTINVGVAFPGASPETMASAVAAPLERRLGRIAGVTEMTSANSLGSSSITLQFELDKDIDAAGREVQAAINAAAADLPSNLPLRPSYRKVNPADTPIIILSLTSDTVPMKEIYTVANDVLAQTLAQLEGVGQVFVAGGQRPAVRVQADPRVLASLGLTLEDVRSALSSASSNKPKGIMSEGAAASALDADTQLFGAVAWRNVLITRPGGNFIRLSDIANVFDDVEDQRVAAWADGKRAVLLIIRRTPNANIIETNDRVKATMPRLAASMSPAIDMRIAGDRSQTIRASVAEVQKTLLIGVLLVVVVVFVFLHSLRATAIPSVVVPLSLLGTFAVMYLIGFSLNNLSLMALTIATGFVVDDAIVVTENITRFLDDGASPLEAALLGAKQIGFTIISITVSLVAVFIPLLFMGGIVGRMFREFSVTLAVAVIVSAVLSLTLTPMMCATLLRPAKRAPTGLSAWWEHAFERLVAAYGRALGWVLDHRRSMLALTLTLMGIAIAMFITIPKGLFPQQDTGSITGATEGPQDTSFLSMRDRHERAMEVLLSDPDIARSTSFIGGGRLNGGFIFADLKPIPPRTVSADAVVNRLRPKASQLVGVNLYLQAAQDIRLSGRSTNTQYQYTLKAATIDELNTWAPRLLEALKHVPQIKDVATDLQANGLELNFKLDRDTAGRHGVTVQQVDNILYDAFGQRIVATSYTERNYFRVVLEVPPNLQQGPEGLASLYVKSAHGDLIPLSELGTSERGHIPLVVNHQGQFPASTLSFNLAPGIALGTAVDAIEGAKSAIGFPASVSASFQGAALVFARTVASLPALILAALLAVYIVLGILYESAIHPVTILSTIPSAGVGALVALIISGLELSIIALVGVILLIGIVKKNAIMMIDFALEAERTENLSPREAIHKASLLRFRPILMTSVAALLGALPLVLSHGLGSELRRPLGITIVGGLVASQLLTMFTTPVVYLTLERFAMRRAHDTVARPATA